VRSTALNPSLRSGAGSLHQLVGDILAQDIIETFGELRSHRHAVLDLWGRQQSKHTLGGVRYQFHAGYD
ncbi:MAG: hypothetical protein ACREA0_21765, partial [bacterium]